MVLRKDLNVTVPNDQTIQMLQYYRETVIMPLWRNVIHVAGYK